MKINPLFTELFLKKYKYDFTFQIFHQIWIEIFVDH